MIDLTDIQYVKDLKSNMHVLFDTPQGKEVMRYLEHACGWYQSVYDPQNGSMTLINDGKRQVVATIKSILRLSPDEIVKLIQTKEQV